MKVACISFDWSKGAIGGGQVTAVAFSEWCKILGHSAQLAAFTGSGAPSKNFVDLKTLYGSKLSTYPEKEWYDVVNSFDLVFFSTPGKRYRTDTQINHLMNWENYFKKLRVPFITIINSERDHLDYLPQGYGLLDTHPYFKAYLVQDSNTWLFHNNLKKPLFRFCPVALPDYLLRDTNQWLPSTQKSGVVYSARITTVKHPNLLSDLTQFDDFLKLVEKVDVFGSGGFHIVESLFRNREPARWNWSDDPYNVYDVLTTKARLKTYKYYWESFGNFKNFPYHFRRFNLSCVEAMSVGCLPIAHPEVVPDWAVDFIVPIRWEKGFDKQQFIKTLEKFDNEYPHYQDLMRKRMLESDYCYRGMKSRVEFLFNELI